VLLGFVPQLHLAQLRHEAEEHADQYQQDGGSDRVPARQRTAHDDGDPEQHDDLESEHWPILAEPIGTLVIREALIAASRRAKQCVAAPDSIHCRRLGCGR
jgi:hypothetical protein